MKNVVLFFSLMGAVFGISHWNQPHSSQEDMSTMHWYEKRGLNPYRYNRFHSLAKKEHKFWRPDFMGADLEGRIWIYRPNCRSKNVRECRYYGW